MFQNLSILFNFFWFVKFANLSGVESESTISKFRKRKRKFLCCVHLPYYLTGTREIGTFHVAIVQRRLRYVQKSVMHMRSCCFAKVSLLLFCRSRRLCCFISILLWSRNLAIMVTDVTLFFPIDEQNKTVKRRPCWCTEKILSVVNHFSCKRFLLFLSRGGNFFIRRVKKLCLWTASLVLSTRLAVDKQTFSNLLRQNDRVTKVYSPRLIY